MANRVANNNKPYDLRPYFAMAIDPIHIGAGGYQLGRVDMSIVREPGTNLPKIPGTSLSGTARTYSAMQEEGKFPGCAGQGAGGEDYEGHCGGYDCPICVTFGFSKGANGSFQGLAQFSDAQLVLFPVHTLAGSVWVTCPDALREVGVEKGEPKDSGSVCVAEGVKVEGKLNLGWLMLSKDSQPFTLNGKLQEVRGEIKKRAVLVSNKLFSHIVNDNLEVRTSVSIDPKTGAASEGALFTYEALPRASVLAFNVIASAPKHYKINKQVPLSNGGKTVKGTVEAGLRFFEYLGVGGMNTRGMGRLRVLGLSDGDSQ